MGQILKTPHLSKPVLFFFLQIAASAFSERYLGLKTDSRVYSVKSHHFCLFIQIMHFWGRLRGLLSKVHIDDMVDFLLPLFLQMTNLAQGNFAEQLKDKQYLIIHPTADGKGHSI